MANTAALRREQVAAKRFLLALWWLKFYILCALAKAASKYCSNELIIILIKDYDRVWEAVYFSVILSGILTHWWLTRYI